MTKLRIWTWSGIHRFNESSGVQWTGQFIPWVTHDESPSLIEFDQISGLSQFQYQLCNFHHSHPRCNHRWKYRYWLVQSVMASMENLFPLFIRFLTNWKPVMALMKIYFQFWIESRVLTKSIKSPSKSGQCVSLDQKLLASSLLLEKSLLVRIAEKIILITNRFWPILGPNFQSKF